MTSRVSINRSDLSLQMVNIIEERRINKLLNKKYEYKPIKNYDPVYHQLFVICEQPDSTSQLKQIKSDRRSYTNQTNYQRQQKSHNFTQIKKHKKTYSHSVELPRISRKFQQANKKLQPKQKQRIYQIYNQSNPNQINLRSKINSLRTQGNYNGKEKLNIMRRFQTLGKQFNSDRQQKKVKILNQIAQQRIKKKNKGLLQITKVNKQWKQIDILKIQTYFVKLRKHKITSLKQQIATSRFQDVAKTFTIPIKQKIPDFIKVYKPINPQIDVNNLIREQKFGIQLDQNVSLYFGALEGGKKNKMGIFVCQNSKFQGTWKNDDKIQGYQITINGYYKGKFKNNKRHGQGDYVWNNGESYYGQWKDGLKNGQGIWRSGKGDSYMGQWKQGKVEGQGVHITATGQIYQGSFKQFLKDGHGKQKFPNGDTYEGDYKHGYPHGKGKYSWRNGIIYQGQFEGGFRKGRGTIIAKNYMQFKGNFQLDLPNGHGQLSYENGDSYVGQLRNGEKHGTGILKLKQEHKILTGTWNSNKFEFAS